MAENIRFDIIARDETTRAFRQIDANLNRTMAGFRKFEAGITGARAQLTGLLAVAATGGGLLYLEKRFVDMGSAIGDTADKIGITASQLQELRYAGQLAGVETETLDAALLVFTRNLGQAELGLGKTGDALEALGIGFGDIAGASPVEILDKVATALSQIEDPMRRNALAAQLFGRAGAQLGPLLAQGAEGLDAFRDKARALGLVVTDDIIRANQEAGDSFDTIGTAIEAAGMNIAAGFLPAIREIEAIMTSPGFQSGLRDAAAGVSEFVQRAIENYDKLVAVAEVIGRIYLAVQGAKIGRVAGVPGMIAGGAAGYFAPEIIGGLANAGAGGAPLDANSTLGRQPLMVDVTEPANMDEIILDRQKRAAKAALAAKLNAKGIAGAGWEGIDLDSTGGGGGGSISRANAERDRAAEAIKRVTDGLNDELKMLGMTDRERAIYNDLLRAGVTESDAAGQAIAALSGQLYDQSEALQHTQRAIEAAHDLTYDFASGLISDLRDGVSAAEALGNAFDRLADRLIDMALDQAINSLFANLAGAGGGAAGGGGGFLAGILKVFGFADGGWTGGGGRGQVAGVVHGQEFVVNAAATSRHRAMLEAINSGYARGGYAGEAGPAGAAAGGGPTSITIDLRGTTGDKALDEKVRLGAEAAYRAAIETSRKSALGWVTDAQTDGEWRL